MIKRMLKFIKWYVLFNFIRPVKKENAAIGLMVGSFDKGGLEQVVLNLYKGYRKNGIPAHILIQGEQAGFFAKCLDNPRHFRIINNDPDEILRFCYKNNIRILHYHYNTYMMKFFSALGFDLYYTIHNTYVWFKDEDWARYKRLLKRCNKIIAVGEWVRQYFIRKSGLTNVVTVNNGVSLQAQSADCGMTRETLGLSANDKVFINVASFNEAKHQVILIGAMEKILQSRSDIKILLLGNILNDKYYQIFQDALERSKSKTNIIVMDYIAQEKLYDFLKTIPDTFVLPSLFEGFPLTAIEALQAGLPVVITDFGFSEDPFYTDVYTVPTAYRDIANVTIDDIFSLSKCKDTSNLNALVERMLFVADNIDDIRAKVKSEKYWTLNVDTMTAGYLEVFGLPKRA